MLLHKNKTLRQLVGVLETANLLSLKLLLKNPASLRLFPGKVFRDYMSLAGRDRWVSKTIFDIFPSVSGTRITLEHLDGGGVFTPLDELAYMALVARALNPIRVFEIGTFRGRTALNFAYNTPDDSRIYTLDLPVEERAAAATAAGLADRGIIAESLTGIDYRGKDAAHKIEQLYGDSTKFDFSPYYDQIDLVFVDGAHYYDCVISDTRNALRMARAGGYIMWHDFANYGDYNDVTRAVLELLPGEDIVQIENSQLAIYRKPS